MTTCQRYTEMFKRYKVYIADKVINRFVLDSVRMGLFSGVTKNHDII